MPVPQRPVVETSKLTSAVLPVAWNAGGTISLFTYSGSAYLQTCSSETL